jgi:hypothetical protein
MNYNVGHGYSPASAGPVGGTLQYGPDVFSSTFFGSDVKGLFPNLMSDISVNFTVPKFFGRKICSANFSKTVRSSRKKRTNKTSKRNKKTSKKSRRIRKAKFSKR